VFNPLRVSGPSPLLINPWAPKITPLIAFAPIEGATIPVVDAPNNSIAPLIVAGRSNTSAPSLSLAVPCPVSINGSVMMGPLGTSMRSTPPSATVV
jgi:hypothetical protein